MILIACLAQACNNNNDDNPAPTTNTNSNLLKTWRASQVLEGTQDITTVFSQYRITFSENNGQKTFSLTDRNGTSATGTWSITTDETTITLTLDGGGSITLNGVSISADELKYNADEQGKTGNVNLSFTLIPV